MVTQVPLRVVALALLLVGCELSGSPQVAVHRQANAGMPLSPVVGRSPNARLGTSVAACRGPGWVAGAPGENAALLFLDAGQYFVGPPYSGADAGAVGLAVACEGLSSSGLVVVMAGKEGAYAHRAPNTDWVLFGGPTTAIARGPTSLSPMLLGSPALATVKATLWTGTGFLSGSEVPGVMNPAQPDFGAAVAWAPGGTAFVVGNPLGAGVRVFNWDGGAVELDPVEGLSGSQFGAALVIGDVHPQAGPELVVGAPGTQQVFIFGLVAGQLQQLMALSGPPNNPVGNLGSFGSSLALEPTPVAGTLQALWVGEPGNDRVWRFIGDAGLETTGTQAGERFGHSLAVAQQELVIGAPQFSGGAGSNYGAVYALPFDTVPYPNTVPMECEVGRVCVTSTCQLGSCVGGVLCVLAGNPLCSAAECTNGLCSSTDAGSGGRPDAGDADAGAADAGAADAGAADAGAADAGAADAGAADAGAADAGKPDAGERDAGTKADAGTTPDGGSQEDAGAAPLDGGLAPIQFGTSGCSGTSAVPLVLLAMVLFRRGRRRR